MKRFLTLAPAGGFSSPWQIYTTRRLYRLWSLARRQGLRSAAPPSEAAAEFQLGKVLEAITEERRVFLRSSGRASLTSVLLAHKARTKKQVILVSAYTCPDVAAAILRAGFRCHLLDIDPETLELRSGALSPSVERDAAGVILSNLYGLVDSVQVWRAFQERNEDFLIVDDACQGFQAHSMGERVGARSGCVGILSFGRGKALCGMGGGAILLPAEVDAQFLQVLEQQVLPAVSTLRNLKSLMLAVLAWMLEHPLLYTVPASLPFLGLGETHCDLSFPIERISEMQSLLALSQLGSLSQEVRERRGRKEFYEAELRGLSNLSLPSLSRSGNVDLLRFPLVFFSVEVRKEQLRRLSEAGLGVNASYPRTIDAYPEFDAHVSFGDISGARTVAERILTLPVHRHASERARGQIVEIIKTGNMIEH